MLVTSDREGPSTQTLARQCRRMEMMGLMPSAFERDADFSVTTPNKMIDPKTIHILQVVSASCNVIIGGCHGHLGLLQALASWVF